MADDFGRQLADLLYGSERSESDSAPSDRFRGVSDKLLGTGMRGAITRALLGFDPPEDATGAEMEAYRNFANASTALAVAPAGVVKAMRGTKAAKAAKAAQEAEELKVPYNIPRAPAKTREEIRPIAQRMAEQLTGEFVRPKEEKSINPAGKSLRQFLQEKEFEKDYITRKTKDVPEPAFADIEKQQGMVKLGISGDTTMADTELLRAGPYALDIPVPLHGGPRFPLGGEGAWASNNPQAANVQKRVGEISEYFGGAPVLGQYVAMGPAGSSFAQHLADANLRAIDLSGMSKRQIEEFNNRIRRGNKESGPRPSFPGIQDKDEAYLWFAFDPKLRIHFNDLMQKVSVTKPLNLPDGRVILDAVTEPQLRNKEIMTSGLSQFQLDPSIRPENIPLSMHPTYTHLIPMKKDAPVTQTRYPIPAELEFPDVTKFIRENYRPAEFTGTFQKASPRQLIDPQAIAEIKMYEELMKEYTGKKKGGAVKAAKGKKVHISDNPDTMRLELANGGGVGEERDWRSKIAGGGIRGIITRGLLGMDPPEDMTPREREIYENMVRLSAPAQGIGAGKAIFIGAKAKTWNKAAANRAVEMEKAGVSPEQIWRETGTFRGADGKLRQEISDVGAVHRNPKELQELGKAKKEEARELQLRIAGIPGQKDLFPKALTEAKRPVREQIKQLKEDADQLMRPSDTRGQSARLALEHPELYKAYPELGDIPVYQGGIGSGKELGSLRGAAGDLEMSVTQSGLRRDPRSTMLHEMQHAVQSLEEMAPGGNAAMAFQDPRAFEILQQIRQKASEPMTYDRYLETLIEANPGKKLSDINPDVARQGYESYVRSIPESVKKFDRDFQVQAANEYYKRLAGEAEARATQYREGMGPTQRREEFPYTSYDVLPEDLIVKPPKGAITAASEGKNPAPAEVAAKLAAQRQELMLRNRAMQELENQFKGMPEPPRGFMSPENILQRMDEIRRREATPSGEQIPLLKRGGKVSISNNPDTMRLEMAVGGPVIGGALKYFGVPRLIGGLAERAMQARLTSLIESGMPLDQIHGDVILNALALLPTKSGLEQSAEEIGRMTSAPQPFVDPSQEMMTGGYDWRPAEEGVVDAMSYYDPLAQNRSGMVSREIPIDLQGSTELVSNTPMEDYLKYGGRDDDRGSDQDASYGQTSMPATEVRFDEQLIDPISGNPYTLGDESSNSAENDEVFGGAIIDPSPKVQQQESASMFATGGAAKKRRKVSFTDNLDTMRLAVQKRK